MNNKKYSKKLYLMFVPQKEHNFGEADSDGEEMGVDGWVVEVVVVVVVVVVGGIG